MNNILNINLMRRMTCNAPLTIRSEGLWFRATLEGNWTKLVCRLWQSRLLPNYSIATFTTVGLPA